MDTLMIVAIAVHALSGVFWAGSSATVANLRGGSAERLFPFQMGAAGLTVLTGLALWAYWRGASFTLSSQILLAGIVCAIIAGAVQGSMAGRARRALAADPSREAELRPRFALAHRIAAGLLMVTVVTMVTSKFF